MYVRALFVWLNSVLRRIAVFQPYRSKRTGHLSSKNGRMLVCLNPGCDKISNTCSDNSTSKRLATEVNIVANLCYFQLVISF